jgi:hypothetical protein
MIPGRPLRQAEISAAPRPESELILACARLHFGSGERSLIKGLVRRKLDWDYLLRAANQHGVIPLLNRHLNATGPELVPETARASLREYMREIAFNNLLLTSELLRLLALFEAQGILAIPFKGPAIAVLAYGDLSLRQFVDLDVLIYRKDFQKAKAVLVGCGYRPEPPLSPRREALFLKTEYARDFSHATPSILVELHWEFAPGYISRPMAFLISGEGLEHLDLKGTMIPSLPAEVLLLAMCVHNTKHMWERLGWICDVAALVESQPRLDWGKVFGLAQAVGNERMLLLGLFLAKDLLETSLPEDICERWRADRAVKFLAGRVKERLFQEDSWRNLLKWIPLHILAKERWRDKIRYCLRMPFTPTASDWEDCRLPDSLAMLHYLIRPFRLVGKYLFGQEKLRD